MGTVFLGLMELPDLLCFDSDIFDVLHTLINKGFCSGPTRCISPCKHYNMKSGALERLMTIFGERRKFLEVFSASLAPV